jgi:ABC-type cobalamin/Fe3+-siderophores transport system ATPase subunit
MALISTCAHCVAPHQANARCTFLPYATNVQTTGNWTKIVSFTANDIGTQISVAGGDLYGKKMSRVEEAIEKFNLNELQNNLLTELSDGEYQRVQLARVWVQDAPLVLLDEPAAHLDANARQELFAELLKWATEENKLVLLCSHELQLNKQFATRVVQF